MIRLILTLISIWILSWVSGLYIDLPETLDSYTYLAPSHLIQILIQGDTAGLNNMGDILITRVGFWKNPGLVAWMFFNSILMIFFLRGLKNSKGSGQ